MKKTNTRMGIKVSIRLILVSFVLLVITPINLAAAENKIVYPVETPVTTTTSDTGKYFSDLTVNVEPKWMVIKQGVEQPWTVHVEVKVLYENKIDHIEFHIWIKTEGTNPWDTDILSVTPTYPLGSTHTGPNYLGGNNYLCIVDADSGSYFAAEDKITLEFTITSPDDLFPAENPHTLVEVYHRTQGTYQVIGDEEYGFNGQESTSDDKIIVIFDVGPEFEIPEIPYGTISAVAISLLALGLAYKRRNIKDLI